MQSSTPHIVNVRSTQQSITGKTNVPLKEQHRLVESIRDAWTRFQDIQRTVIFMPSDLFLKTVDEIKHDESDASNMGKHGSSTPQSSFVMSMAKRYLGRGLQFFDLVQEGTLGLMKAVENVDVNEAINSAPIRRGGFGNG